MATPVGRERFGKNEKAVEPVDEREDSRAPEGPAEVVVAQETAEEGATESSEQKLEFLDGR